MDLNRIIEHNVMNMPWPIPDESIDCCVTSPPYWGLRDYGVAGQLGLEKTPEEFIEKMVLVFEEVRRVLKPQGTCWVNIGDSYASTAKNRTPNQAQAKSTLNGSTKGQATVLKQQSKIVNDLKEKDIVGIPWMLAFCVRILSGKSQTPCQNQSLIVALRPMSTFSFFQSQRDTTMIKRQF